MPCYAMLAGYTQSQARVVVLALLHRTATTTRDAWRVFVPDDGSTLDRVEFRRVVSVFTGGRVT